MGTYNLLFLLTAPAEIILHEFHKLEEHLLTRNVRTTVNRSGGMATAVLQTHLSLKELREGVLSLDLTAVITINE